MSDQSERLKAIGEQLLMCEDKVYGEVRRQITCEYIAAGEPRPRSNWLYSRLVEARSRVQSEIRKREEAERLLDHVWSEHMDDEEIAACAMKLDVMRVLNAVGGCGLPGHESEVEHGKD